MKRLLAALCFFAASTPALATPIFAEDFEDGAADGWAPSGGDARLTQYAGNTSLRLSGRTAVVARVRTRGVTRVTIAAAMAAESLEGVEYCVVEASSDGGRTWLQVLRVSSDQDDGVTLHRNALTDPHLDNADTLLIGARNGGANDDDRCWLDDVRVTGDRVEEPASPRASLTRELLSSASVSAMPPMSAFLPTAGATPPRSAFNGTLAFSGPMAGFRLHTDSFESDRDPTLRIRELPAIRVALAQNGDRVIPLTRGPITSGHPNWDYAIGVGRAWSEAGDAGMTRAALPFALIETNANCTHNGVLSFLFDDTGAISNVAWEIASETCSYMQFDAWGVSDATYARGDIDSVAAIARDSAERAHLMPARPFSQLARDYPGADLAAFASPADVNPTALTTFGVVYRGVHYLGGCDTRAGTYPFCEELLLPSYSLAKSMAAGLGLMRLELLEPGAMNQRIADYVEQCADWDAVTFGNALDMATGRFASPDDQTDENALTSGRFFLSTSDSEKAPIACSLYPRRQAPGQRWVYHTPDTYILGAAMTAAWRDAHGADADFFNDVLRDGVYAPLHLSAEIAATRRTSDGQPFFGWGLTLTRDDVAKIGDYLTAPTHETPLVDPHDLDAAMQRDPSDPGLRAGDDTLRYNNGFWAYNAQGPLHCATPVWIPFFSGFGGNVVALMPNGLTYYYFSDGNDFRWARAVVAANAIAPLCPRVAP